MEELVYMLRDSFKKVVIFLLVSSQCLSRTQALPQFTCERQKLRQILQEAESLSLEWGLELRVIPIVSENGEIAGELLSELKRVCIKELCKSQYFLPDFACLPIDVKNSRVQMLLDLPVNFFTLRIILCKWDEVVDAAGSSNELTKILPNFTHCLKEGLFRIKTTI